MSILKARHVYSCCSASRLPHLKQPFVSRVSQRLDTRTAFAWTVTPPPCVGQRSGEWKPSCCRLDILQVPKAQPRHLSVSNTIPSHCLEPCAVLSRSSSTNAVQLGTLVTNECTAIAATMSNVAKRRAALKAFSETPSETLGRPDIAPIGELSCCTI